MIKKVFCIFTVLILSFVLVEPSVEIIAAEKMTFSKNDLQIIGNIFDEAKSTEDQNEFVDVLKDEDGKRIKTITTTVDRKINKDEKNGTIDVTIINNKKIENSNGLTEYDSSIDEISFNKKGEFYVNGEMIPIEELNQVHTPSTQAITATGGLLMANLL